MSLTDSKKKKVYSNVDLTRFVPSNKILKVAELPKVNKTNLNKIRQIGNKAKDKFSIHKLLDSKQKPATIIPLKTNKDK
tara:strand:+ start:295 stop:531 length:237 start_codon:yes stop_codon:yes gene_type:complete